MKVKHKMKLKIRAAVMTPETFRNFNSADLGSATSFVTVDPNCISIDSNKQQQSRFEWLVIEFAVLCFSDCFSLSGYTTLEQVIALSNLYVPSTVLAYLLSTRTRLLETNVLLSFGRRVCFKPR